jgi:hypothetical protein
LTRFVAATGGETIREGEFFEDALTVALTRLQSSYVLGFHGAGKSEAGPRLRRIRIELSGPVKKRHPEALVRHREGYFSVDPPVGSRD